MFGPSLDLTRRGEPMFLLERLFGGVLAVLTGIVLLVRGLFAVKDLWRVARIKSM